MREQAHFAAPPSKRSSNVDAAGAAGAGGEGEAGWGDAEVLVETERLPIDNSNTEAAAPAAGSASVRYDSPEPTQMTEIQRMQAEYSEHIRPLTPSTPPLPAYMRAAVMRNGEFDYEAKPIPIIAIGAHA